MVEKYSNTSDILDMLPLSDGYFAKYLEPDLKDFLEKKYRQYNCFEFIERDPISIPHMFSKKQDIEIMGFWAAILSWGRRETIIKKCREIVELMGGEPYYFILNHQESDLKPFLKFRHRTFNSTDTLYFIDFFRRYYAANESLEDAFLISKGTGASQTIEQALIKFRQVFFTTEFPERTKKHISTPDTNAACKRLNMFLRWMVRKDSSGVDFGIWNQIKPSQLMIPLDVHVERVARKLKLITRKQRDWKTVKELTANLAMMDSMDPAKYDFALFGLGVEEHL